MDAEPIGTLDESNASEDIQARILASRVASLSRNEAVLWLAEEEKKTFRYLLAIRSILNTTVSPVYQLPDELLARIFSFVRYRDNLDELMQVSRRGWILATHVCRWWRNVALQHALFWTDICINNPRSIDLLRTFMHRSHGSLVDLNISIPDTDSFPSQVFDDTLTGLVDILSEHQGHISSLRLEKTPKFMDNLWRKLPLHFPSIQRLEIIIDSQQNPNLGVRTIITPPNAEHDLHVLTLRHVYIPFQSGIFSHSLRQLTLHNQHHPQAITYSFIPSLDIFLDLLQRLPMLTLLDLSYAGPKRQPGVSVAFSSPDRRRVELKSLEQLYIHNSLQDIAYLLNCLIIPKKCGISLKCPRLDMISSHGFYDILPRDLSGLPCLKSVTSVNLELDSTDKGNSIGIRNDSVDVSIDLCTHFRRAPAETITEHYISTFPSVFFDSPLKSLQLSCDFEVLAEHHWRTLLSKYPLLNILELNETGTIDPLPQNLYRVFNVLRHVPGGYLVCPRLQKLHLYFFTIACVLVFQRK
ncbi:hypothetical protein C8Q75DRAFT_382516 [Abortiporus biennis]|nr:hypothetical protein C8Q75DRAFT_382516 [Abortiporus biennis]